MRIVSHFCLSEDSRWWDLVSECGSESRTCLSIWNIVNYALHTLPCLVHLLPKYWRHQKESPRKFGNTVFLYFLKSTMHLSAWLNQISEFLTIVSSDVTSLSHTQQKPIPSLTIFLKPKPDLGTQRVFVRTRIGNFCRKSCILNQYNLKIQCINANTCFQSTLKPFLKRVFHLDLEIISEPEKCRFFPKIHMSLSWLNLKLEPNSRCQNPSWSQTQLHLKLVTSLIDIH